MISYDKIVIEINNVERGLKQLSLNYSNLLRKHEKKVNYYPILGLFDKLVIQQGYFRANPGGTRVSFPCSQKGSKGCSRITNPDLLFSSDGKILCVGEASV